MTSTVQNHDIVCISSIDWDFLWQGQQEIMSRLAQAGNRVLYIENTGVRRPRLADLPRLKQRLRNWWRSYAGVRQESENLYILSPLLLPFPYSRLARWINGAVIWRVVRRWMKSLGFANPIVWSFLPTPLALNLARRLDGKLLLYHRADDFRSSSPQARRIESFERRMLRAADLVITNSRSLARDSLRENGETYQLSYGVNLEHLAGPAEPPAELARLPRPIIGYVGGIHQHVDFALLAAAARQAPQWSFVFVGPLQADPGPLAGLPNAHFLGERPHAELGAYLAAFDVALIPYARSAYTDNVFPAKLPEYFAFGLPVVSTPLPEVSAFRDEHGPLLSLAGDAPAFVAAIAAELAQDTPERRSRRRAIAQTYHWPRRMEALSVLISARLEQLRHERAKTWQRRMRQVVRRTYARTAQGLAALLLLYLVIFESPLVWRLAGPLLMAAPPQPSSAIVVLAGGVGETGRPGTSTFERAHAAGELYARGLSGTVVVVSGFRYVERETRDLRRILMSLGVPEKAILLEERGVNTFQYARYVSELAASHGWSSVLLVSASYHMRRAMLTFQRQAPRVRFLPAPVRTSSFYEHTRGISAQQLGALAHEAAGILYYWWKGYLEPAEGG
ncbi:MAG: YdcF family protein [Candidatus Tectomicrobia bacterium]|nr:YdcF family protein [Candidatus Tectomicrobia bacterium]